ncbi:MAG: GntR family transcriptional regulator [Litoreibacter sp.]|uniref:GntR family transcriptional regulator n=1 Tax=Litoreibacter sp. TaxID=1969459 RepID=UPI0032970104
MTSKAKSNLKGTVGRALNATPLYEQVKERVMHLILDGTWPEGHILPAETELARQLGVSFGTARQALQILTKEGVLLRKPRIGTVVTGRTPHHTLDRFYKHYRLHNTKNELINTQTVMKSIQIRPASADEARCFRCDESIDLISLVRVRVHDSRPVMIDHFLIPEHFVPGFPRAAADVPPLLLNHLRDEYGLRIRAVREALRADIAGPEDISLLDLNASDGPTPILVIDDVCFDSKNQALLTASHRALSDDYRYVNEVQ